MSEQHSFLNFRTGAAALGLAAVVACGAGVAPALAVEAPQAGHAASSTTNTPPASTLGYVVHQYGYVWIQLDSPKDFLHGYALKADGTLEYFNGTPKYDGLGGATGPGMFLTYRVNSDGYPLQFSGEDHRITLAQAYQNIGKVYPGSAKPSPAATAPAKTAPAQAAPAQTAPAASAKKAAPAAQGTEAPKGELAQTGLTGQGKLLAVAGAAAVLMGAGMIVLRRRFSAGA